MPVILSARCLERLLPLLLLCTSAWGGSPADPAMTTQDSSQTEANSVTKMQAGHETSGPDAATEEPKVTSKQDTYSVSEHKIVLSDVSGAPVEKNVPLLNPTKVELTCKLDTNSNLKNPQMTWKKGSETISHTSKAQNCWTIELTITDSSQLGTYTCILKAGKKEVSAAFHLQVPKIEGREKPIITYEGDRAVMVCETRDDPKAWTWYIANGTERAAIDKIMGADKFQIKRQSGNVNRLEILKLTKEDNGVYWCEAAFELGNSKARFEVRVLSILEPLKPFVAIVAEVVILVTTIFLYEVYSKRRGKGGEKELDQTEQLKSKDNVTVQRKLFKAEN